MPPFSFGTAGIRAKAGPGPDELNRASVRSIAEAVLAHLGSLGERAFARGICVGFDGRRDSRAFADEIVQCALARGFDVRRFDDPVATPLLAFATRSHDAIAGLMVTASHNPPADNGIKLYLEGGAQIVAPHDAAIEQRLRDGAPSPTSARTPGTLSALDERDVARYLDALGVFMPVDAGRALPVLAYTATCGVGSALTRAVLARAGATVHEVRAQAEPQSDFGGLSSPNPEHEEALAELRVLADAVAAEVAFAHDPDADRLAVLARDHGGALRRLTGDEVGALIGAFLLAGVSAPERALLATSHVSGDLLGRVAEAAGAQFLRTNTGFKWITSEARARAVADDLHYLFGYEEAIGYAFPALGEDKDGVAALHVVLALLRVAGSRGNSLLDELHALFRRHGVHATRQLSVTLGGAGTHSTREAVLGAFLTVSPDALLGEPGALTDHRASTPPATLIELRGVHGTRVCVRPSGTEPKLKLYLHARANVVPGEAVSDAELRCHAALDALALRTTALLGR